MFFSKLFTDLIVFDLKLFKASDFFLNVLKRFYDHIVASVLGGFLSICSGFSSSFNLEVGSEGAYHIHIQACDVIVVVMDVLVLLLVLSLEFFDSLVFLRFDLGDFSLALGLHVLSQTSHLGFVLLLDLVSDAFVFLSLGSGQCVVVFV